MNPATDTRYTSRKNLNDSRAGKCQSAKADFRIRVFCGWYYFLCARRAAQQTGAITGQVTDPSGAFVAAADVSTKLSGTDKASKSTTDEAGKFSFSGLTPELYELVVQHAGFDDAVKSIQVAAGATVDQTMSLSLARSDSASVDAKLSAVPTENPTAQTITTVVQDDFKNTPALSVTDIFDLSPGVTTTQGNGPRDISVSIRGSNERQTFAVRNIQISEDGFPVTQPDGTGRTDLTDPHAYSGVDVVQGPSSALYGNYGSGGAVNFHTRQTEGIEVGTDFGSFGFENDYAAFGASGDQYRFSGFLSNVRGSQYTDHTQYNTFTANILASYSVTPRDRITIKFIDNELQTNLSIRLSLSQYQTNPWQLGCGSLAAAGCASVSLYANGFNGTKVALSADQAGLGRNDRRTIRQPLGTRPHAEYFAPHPVCLGQPRHQSAHQRYQRGRHLSLLQRDLRSDPARDAVRAPVDFVYRRFVQLPAKQVDHL